jgi:hypothetical protein
MLGAAYLKGEDSVRKVMVWILVFLTFSGVSPQAAGAADSHEARQAAKVKRQIDGFAPGAFLRVKLKDQRQIEGKLGDRSEEGFQLDTPQTIQVSYSEVKKVAEWDGQSGPVQASNSQPSPHRHLLLKVVIIFAAAFGLAAGLASLDK